MICVESFIANMLKQFWFGNFLYRTKTKLLFCSTFCLGTRINNHAYFRRNVHSSRCGSYGHNVKEMLVCCIVKKGSVNVNLCFTTYNNHGTCVNRLIFNSTHTTHACTPHNHTTNRLRKADAVKPINFFVHNNEGFSSYMVSARFISNIFILSSFFVRWIKSFNSYYTRTPYRHSTNHIRTPHSHTTNHTHHTATPPTTRTTQPHHQPHAPHGIVFSRHHCFIH